jgi:hypothetical protein
VEKGEGCQPSPLCVYAQLSSSAVAADVRFKPCQPLPVFLFCGANPLFPSIAVKDLLLSYRSPLVLQCST